MAFVFVQSKMWLFRDQRWLTQTKDRQMAEYTSTGFRLDDGQIEVVDPIVAECLRKKSFSERLEMVFEANRSMRLLIAGRLKTDHPDWTDAQIQAEVARRMLHGVT